jgi:hypothetical protein
MMEMVDLVMINIRLTILVGCVATTIFGISTDFSVVATINIFGFTLLRQGQCIYCKVHINFSGNKLSQSLFPIQLQHQLLLLYE